MNLIILIQCGKRQKEGCHKAKDLYKSPIFKANWNEAETEYPDEKKIIISSCHGLLEPDKTVCKYDTPFPDKEEDLEKWAQKVVDELLKRGFNPTKEKLIIYASKRIGFAIVNCFPILNEYVIISRGWYGQKSITSGTKIQL